MDKNGRALDQPSDTRSNDAATPIAYTGVAFVALVFFGFASADQPAPLDQLELAEDWIDTEVAQIAAASLAPLGAEALVGQIRAAPAVAFGAPPDPASPGLARIPRPEFLQEISAPLSPEGAPHDVILPGLNIAPAPDLGPMVIDAKAPGGNDQPATGEFDAGTRPQLWDQTKLTPISGEDSTPTTAQAPLPQAILALEPPAALVQPAADPKLAAPAPAPRPLRVTGAYVNLRAGPSLEAEVIDQLQPGALLFLSRSTEVWAEVYRPDGTPAFIAREFVDGFDGAAAEN